MPKTNTQIRAMLENAAFFAHHLWDPARVCVQYAQVPETNLFGPSLHEDREYGAMHRAKAGGGYWSAGAWGPHVNVADAAERARSAR